MKRIDLFSYPRISFGEPRKYTPFLFPIKDPFYDGEREDILNPQEKIDKKKADQFDVVSKLFRKREAEPHKPYLPATYFSELSTSVDGFRKTIDKRQEEKELKDMDSLF